jgi:ankyrin repeat protein
MKGDHETVCQLLTQGTDLNEVDAEGRWALLAAVERRDIEMMKMLLEAGANPNFSGPDDPAPSGYEEGSIQVRASKGGRPPLLEAAKNNFADGVELLLRHRANVNKAGRDFTTPLFGAAVTGAQEALKVLLQHKPDLESANFDGWRPLEVAIRNGYIEVVKLLLEAGACTGDPEAEDNYAPLFTAMLGGHIEAVRLLLDHGANPNQVNPDNIPSLCWDAANYGYAEIVELLLLDWGANPNQANSDGITPLWIAAARGHAGVVDILLRSGADPNATDPSGTTPLGIAEANGHQDVVDRLRLAGAV